MGHDAAGFSHLRQLLHAPFHRRPALWALWHHLASLYANNGALPRFPVSTPHAAASRLSSRCTVHLVCRKHRNLVPRLDLSWTVQRMVTGVAAKARRLVPVDDSFIRAGHPCSPTATELSETSDEIAGGFSTNDTWHYCRTPHAGR